MPTRTSKRSTSGGSARASAGASPRSASSRAGTASRKGASSSRAAKPKSSSRSSSRGTYTDPDLRERLKREITDADKGGRAGQWSARKAQLLAQAYERAGGGYTGPKTARQKHLSKWTSEEWQTRDGSARARTGSGTKRYLPKQAWGRLSDDEAKRTDDAKQRASRAGRQFVGNTPKAKAAGRAARSTSSSRG